MTWKLIVEHEDFSRRTLLYLGKVLGDRTVVVEGATMHQYDSYAAIPKTPWMHLDALDAKAMMQAFMDAAWDMGLRPSDYRSHDKATQAHLKDLRSIIEHLVGDKLVERVIGTQTIIRPPTTQTPPGRAREPDPQRGSQESLGAAQSGPGADWPKAPEDVQRDAGGDAAQGRSLRPGSRGHSSG